jgi:carbonic anhydrase
MTRREAEGAAMRSRRRWLAGLLGVAACPVCARLDSLAAAEARWGYGPGARGPAHWGELTEDYRACGLGTEQSPIDLAGAVRAELPRLRLDYGTVALRPVDNGHTIQLDVGAGHRLELDGRSFALRQFHFHHPSEHALDGRRWPMEAHFVHRGEGGGLAVIGLFLEPGAAGEEWTRVFEALAGRDTGELALAGLFPGDLGYLRYAGSLTTPPCSETVEWLVVRAPVAVPAAGIERFAARFPDNARPIQPRHRRFVLERG